MKANNCNLASKQFKPHNVKMSFLTFSKFLPNDNHSLPIRVRYGSVHYGYIFWFMFCLSHCCTLGNYVLYHIGVWWHTSLLRAYCATYQGGSALIIRCHFLLSILFSHKNLNTANPWVYFGKQTLTMQHQPAMFTLHLQLCPDESSIWKDN